MKYIRTKNGIYDYEPTHNIDVDGFVVQHINGWNKPLTKEDIIKIADTIEELCDEFVLCEDNHCCIVGDIEAKEMATTNYGIIYGAIWTDKGLIYVAKMNEKGNLELL